MSSFFVKDVLTGWDGRIYMRSVPGKLDWMELTERLPCGSDEIPVGFRWNGASSGVFRYLAILNFPKWKHPVSTCRHDYRCWKAKNAEQRKFADEQFMKDVGIGGTKWEQMKGFAAVRIGSFFSNLKRRFIGVSS